MEKSPFYLKFVFQWVKGTNFSGVRDIDFFFFEVWISL